LKSGYHLSHSKQLAIYPLNPFSVLSFRIAQQDFLTQWTHGSGWLAPQVLFCPFQSLDQVIVAKAKHGMLLL